MWLDLHTHIPTDARCQPYRKWFDTAPPYRAVPAAGYAEEAEALFRLAETPPFSRHLLPCAGLHPWQAARGRAEIRRLRPLMARSPWIGEIGLDRPWCDVPLKVQLDAFMRQLDLAVELHKPVLIHGKGYEAEILGRLRDFPEPVIVHWYSLDDPVLCDAYLDAGYHFTLGPDQARGADTAYLWDHVPLDRVHLETDGLEALVWAGACPGDPAPAPPVLLESLRQRVEHFARRRNLAVETLTPRIWAQGLALLGDMAERWSEDDEYT